MNNAHLLYSVRVQQGIISQAIYEEKMKGNVMNREILFRGKRIDNGEWVKGGLLYSENDYWIMDSIMMPAKNDNQNKAEPFLIYKVDSKTVGQYTGVNDKYDKKIFEGDLLQLNEYGKCFSEVIFFRGTFCLKGFNWDTFNCEAIGNIYDQKEPEKTSL